MIEAFSIILIGIFITHYFELFELPLFNKIRSIIYFRKGSDVVNQDILKRHYKGIKEATYSPVNIAQSVLVQSQQILSNKLNCPDYLIRYKGNIDVERIIKIADFFLEYGEKIKFNDIEGIVLYYNFEYNDLGKKWYSGMAQGQAAEVILSAYYLTMDLKYLIGSQKILNVLRIPIESGGALVNVNGGIWFEEYASEKNIGKSPLVLNGHLFAMDGIFWMKQILPDEWDEIYKLALNAVNTNIYKYVTFCWSRYCLTPTIANGFYHRLHVQQLKRIENVDKKLYKIKKYRRKFELMNYIPFGIFTRIIVSHNTMLILILVFNIVTIGIIYYLLKYFIVI